MQNNLQDSARLMTHGTSSATLTKSPQRWLVIAGVVLGFFAGVFLSVSAESPRRQPRSPENLVGAAVANRLPARPNLLIVPADTLSPKQVVEIQMEALFSYHTHRSAIHQVFAHASPTNRAVTGPLENFERMILQPDYWALVTSQHYLIGQAVEREKIATLLVTTIDEQGQMSVFRFFLSRQSGTYPGCWMTDGVFRLVGGWGPSALPRIEAKESI